MTIGIYGCGWLGESLAIHFLREKRPIVGSTTSLSKINHLKKLGAQTLELKLADTLVCDNLLLLKTPDIFIINIPPGLRGAKAEAQTSSYLNRIKLLFDAIYDDNKKYIFISSTSVYGDLQGEVSEKNPCLPSTESGKEILKTEEYLLQKYSENLTILRFGGLIDEKRHPATHLAGKKELLQAEAPVNLIHKVDCIGIIEKIIIRNSWGECFNGVCDEHSSRKDFYTKACKKRNLEIPEFSDPESFQNYKLISNQKIRLNLKYNFKYSKLDEF